MTTRETKIVEAAARLRDAHARHSPCAPVRDLFEPNDLAAGYEIQDINTAYWCNEGRVVVGRKIGLTSRAVQMQLGVDQPDYGMLYADMCFADGEPIPGGRLLQPKAEGEIAFRIGRDLDHEALTIDRVISSIEYAVAAIEVVGSRIADWNIRFLDTVADNASSGVYVLGTEVRQLGSFDPWLCGMVLEKMGEPVSTGAGAACLGNPFTATLWLARKMVEVGRPLRAGDLVLSGALGPLVSVAAGDSLELRISGLGSVRTMLEP